MAVLDKVRESLAAKCVVLKAENDLLREAVAQLTLENQRLMADCLAWDVDDVSDWEDRLSA